MIEKLSEDAQAQNKNIKRFREDFSWKCTQEKTKMFSIGWWSFQIHILITSVRNLPQKPLKSLLPKAIELLDSSTVHTATTNDKHNSFDTSSLSKCSEIDETDSDV